MFDWMSSNLKLKCHDELYLGPSHCQGLSGIQKTFTRSKIKYLDKYR